MVWWEMWLEDIRGCGGLYERGLYGMERGLRSLLRLAGLIRLGKIGHFV